METIKKTYETPRLTEHGAVTQVTLKGGVYGGKSKSKSKGGKR